MLPSGKFKLEEKEVVISVPQAFGQFTPTNSIHYKIIRKSDDRIIKTFYDYLEALKYLEALEDRAWLVS